MMLHCTTTSGSIGSTFVRSIGTVLSLRGCSMCLGVPTAVTEHASDLPLQLHRRLPVGPISCPSASPVTWAQGPGNTGPIGKAISRDPRTGCLTQQYLKDRHEMLDPVILDMPSCFALLSKSNHKEITCVPLVLPAIIFAVLAPN